MRRTNGGRGETEGVVLATKGASDSSPPDGTARGSPRARGGDGEVREGSWRRPPTSLATAASFWLSSRLGTRPFWLAVLHPQMPLFHPTRSQSPAWPTVARGASRVRRSEKRVEGASAGSHPAGVRAARGRRCTRGAAGRTGRRRAGAGRGRRGRSMSRCRRAPTRRAAWLSEIQPPCECTSGVHHLAAAQARERRREASSFSTHRPTRGRSEMQPVRWLLSRPGKQQRARPQHRARRSKRVQAQSRGQKERRRRSKGSTAEIVLTVTGGG